MIAKPSPMVGIFWMMPNLEDFFHVSSIELEKALPYGDWLLGTIDHTDLWDRLFAEGELKMLPHRYQEDYTLLPRGRVSYNTKTEKFTIYYGNWGQPKHKKLIMDRFNLHKRNTIFEEDGHYRV